MKLLIAIPSNDYMHYEFTSCLVKLVSRLKDDGVDFDVAIQGGTLVYVARDKLAYKAIDEGYTHVLWLDSDMVFRETILDDLLFCGEQFVTGIYHARRKGYASVIFKTIDLNHIERFEEYPKEPFRIAGCGFGCVLVSVEMLKAVCMKHTTCFTPLQDLGEDIAFCKRARDLGFELWCDPSVVCGHIGHIAIYPEDHELWKKSIINYDEVT